MSTSFCNVVDTGSLAIKQRLVHTHKSIPLIALANEKRPSTMSPDTKCRRYSPAHEYEFVSSYVLDHSLLPHGEV